MAHQHELYRVAESDQNKPIDGHWRYTEHDATHIRVMTCQQRQTLPYRRRCGAPPVSPTFTAGQRPDHEPALPRAADRPHRGPISNRLFAMKHTETITGGKICSRALPVLQSPERLRSRVDGNASPLSSRPTMWEAAHSTSPVMCLTAPSKGISSPSTRRTN